MSPHPAHDAHDVAAQSAERDTDALDPLHSEAEEFGDESLQNDAGENQPLPTGETELENAILAKLDFDKAQDLVLIDLRGKSPMSDAMIVASGRSHRHVGALADHLLRLFKEMGLGKVKVEGMPHCDWVLLDAGDVIVHLFRPEVRTFYNIEKIWAVDSAHRGLGRN
ncbi:ribosome silencing factor [Brevundimonas sp.]|uniref:ribosome silencing factor n=1 Tax=Brevundimonas sp. TaxID=1871086 RepID=UPI002FC7AD7C